MRAKMAEVYNERHIFLRSGWRLQGAAFEKRDGAFSQSPICAVHKMKVFLQILKNEQRALLHPLQCPNSIDATVTSFQLSYFLRCKRTSLTRFLAMFKQDYEPQVILSP